MIRSLSFLLFLFICEASNANFLDSSKSVNSTASDISTDIKIPPPDEFGYESFSLKDSTNVNSSENEKESDEIIKTEEVSNENYEEEPQINMEKGAKVYPDENLDSKTLDRDLQILLSIVKNPYSYKSKLPLLKSKNNIFIAKWFVFVVNEIGTFEEFNDFLKEYKTEIPRRKTLVRVARDKLSKSSDISASDSYEWFVENDYGNLKYYFDTRRLTPKNYHEIFKLKKIRSASGLSQYLFSKRLSDQANDLVWLKRYSEALSIRKSLSKRDRYIIDARIYLRTGRKSFLQSYRHAIKSKYYLLDSGEGMLYDMIKYLAKQKDFRQIEALVSAIPERTKYAEQWWELKEYLILNFIRRKKYDISLDLASKNDYLYDENMVSRSSWLAGFIAHKFLKDYSLAISYFKKVYDSSSYAITKSRGAYWIARSYEMLKNQSERNFWLKKGTSYPLTFYGQMSIIELLKLEDKRLFTKSAKDFEGSFSEESSVFKEIYDLINIRNNNFVKHSTEKSIASLRRNPMFNAVEVFLNFGMEFYAKEFFLKLIETHESKEDLVIAIKFFKDRFSQRHYTDILQKAIWQNVVLMTDFYKTIEIKTYSNLKPIIHAIISRESSFNAGAISSVGALGMMQIMPGTAKSVTSSMNIKYSYSKLLNDPEYNIEIGSYYIAKLLSIFDYSYPLAIASYNAGPLNVKKWMVDNDFNNSQQDVVDWIEMIPFKETRNYVMRVIENDTVYRYLLLRQNIGYFEKG